MTVTTCHLDTSQEQQVLFDAFLACSEPVEVGQIGTPRHEFISIQMFGRCNLIAQSQDCRLSVWTGDAPVSRTRYIAAAPD
jgi:hypothetical protein